MPKTIYAKDCKCCKCGKQAVCFWPIVDPDITENPYCRECVEKAKIKVLLGFYKIDRKYAQNQKQKNPT